MPLSIIPLPAPLTEPGTGFLLAHAGADLDRIGLSSTVVAYTLVAVLAVGALALTQRWRRPRFSTAGTEPGQGDPGQGDGVVDGVSGIATTIPGVPGDGPPRGPGWSAARVVSATLLVITIAVGWAGSSSIGVNPVPAGVLFFTLAGPVLVLILGDLWTPLAPHATLAGAIRRGLGRPVDPPGRPHRPATALWWVPAAGLASYAVFWLAVPDGLQPRVITAWLTAYSVVMVGLGAALGPAVTRRLEGFTVLFAAIGRLSPLDWSRGRPRLRNPLAATGHAAVDRRELAVLVVAMGVAVFDAVNASTWWAGLLGVRSETGYTMFNGAGLAWAIAAVGALWWGAGRGAARLAGDAPVRRAEQAWTPSAVTAGAPMAGVGAAPVAPPEVDRSDEAAAPGAPGTPAPPSPHDAPVVTGAPTDDARAGPGPGAPEPAGDARTLAPALAVLVVGFTLAHQFGSMLVNGLSVLALSSDPLTRGWDLFATRDVYADPDSWLTLSGWVALVGVVAATLVALIVAWDRWLASGHARPARSMPVIFCTVAAAGVVGVGLLVGG